MKNKIQNSHQDKEREKNLKRNPWDNQKCGICYRLKISAICKGHGGGGGSSSDNSDQSSSDKASNSLSSTTKPISQIGEIHASRLSLDRLSPEAMLKYTDYEINFGLIFIAGLIAKDELKINNDKENGCFSIEINPNTFLKLTEKEKKQFCRFIEFVEKQFSEYYISLSEKDKKKCSYHISDNLITMAPSLKIKISDPKIYDKFISRLLTVLNALKIDGNKMSINLIASYLNDASKITSDMRDNVGGELKKSLNHIDDSLDVPSKNEIKFTPFSKKLKPNNFEY